jgi:N-[(2S)-2-amino-2-carboxyethyl]-L-glutamate dehydrogenase
MLYLNDRTIREIGFHWPTLVDAVESAARIVDSGDYAQPIKPYLRYKNLKNRIIAMPAFVGGDVDAAGIKWIASFPGNLDRGLPRAHSVIVLNEPDTGRPAAILNATLPSVVRTAAVSGLMIDRYLQVRPLDRIHLGIIGWGPIGRYHYQMARGMFKDRIEKVRVYDIRGVDLSGVPEDFRDRTEASRSWEEVYAQSNVFITCTVSDSRYINVPPPRASLQLNVSLRDYEPKALAEVKAIVVDDWEEVCRENTDIEQLHVERGLSEGEVSRLTDIVCRDRMQDFAEDEPVLFCPMGLAAFDIAIASYFVRKAQERGLGQSLPNEP